MSVYIRLIVVNIHQDVKIANSRKDLTVASGR